MNWSVVSLALVVAVLVACDNKSEIKVYRVSKAPLEEKSSQQQNAMPANAPSPSMPGGMGSGMTTRDASAPQLKWTKPEGWNEVPASSMRYASFSAGGNENKIDISVVMFPGEGGSDVENVNRWRGQIGLPPMSLAAVTSQITTLKAGDATFAMVDIADANARTLAAWVRRDARVWFFKVMGPSAAVEKEKPNFVKFVQSVRF